MTAEPAATRSALADYLLRLAAPSAPAAPEIEVAEYDWSVPHRFVPAEWARLEAFAADLAERISAGLSGLLQTELSVGLRAADQLYAADLDTAAEGAGFAVALTAAPDRPAGLILLPEANALGWVEKLLGGSTAGDAGRELSTVERSLLMDVAGVLAEAISAASGAVRGPAFAHAERFTRGTCELPGTDTDDYVRVDFACEGTEDANDLSVVLLGGEAERIAAAGGPTRSPDDVRGDLRAHLERVRLTAAARVAAVHVPVRDLFALEPGDVLTTPRKLGEPIDLVLADRILFKGVPARCEGRYAVKITEVNPNDRDAGGPG